MKHFYWKFLILFLGVMAIWGFMNRCCTAQENFKPFKANYFKKYQHIAIIQKIENASGKLSEPIRAELRLGPMPHYPSSGTTKVEYLDNDKESLGQHSTRDRTKLRSCDLDQLNRKKLKHNTQLLPVGAEVQTLLPFIKENGELKKIHYVKFSYRRPPPQPPHTELFDINELVEPIYAKFQ